MNIQPESVVNDTTGSSGGVAGFRTRLAGLPPVEQHRLVLELVCVATTRVISQVQPDAPATVDPVLPFQDLGFDSLAAVELHERLTAATGLALPVTLAFDHPTPQAVADLVVRQFVGAPAAARPARPRRDGADEPIAIVGIGCRYPGGVFSAADLWQLVVDGRHVIEEFPTDRGWDLAGLFDPDPDRPGTSYVRHGAFLDTAADFDADFFGIGPREASAMDPQQRLVLETSWVALEHAGIDPTSLRGSRTGVFVGAEPQEYGPRLYEAPAGLDGYLLAGNAPSVVAGRVAYTLGLHGPTLTVDTACSGSLVALHLASQALRTGEASLALAGGVAVMGSPGTFTAFSRQRGLAPDGRCRPFADAADGTGFAEGIGILVLERLGEARRSGHRVLAVLRGSAINSDGASNGLTAPSGPAQQQVIAAALADAGLVPGDVDAVEAHGTGTRLGDPIEAQALLAAYGQERDEPLWIGSLKSNIGHTQAAAGVAGVIKMIMALRHSLLPATLHVDRPTSRVDWTAGAVALLTDARPWPALPRPRRAGISSFGVSGTNAHVIVEEADTETTETTETTDAGEPAGQKWPTVLPLVLSARSAPALRAQAGQLLPLLRAGISLPDTAYALATTRAALEHRAVVLAADVSEAVRGLEALATGATNRSGVYVGRMIGGRVAYMFTGQGTQRLAAGQALARQFPAFARAFADAADQVDVHLDRPLRSILAGDDQALLDQTRYAQAAIFVTEVALYRLLESWGLRPDYVLGHSVGELAAAHVAGVLTLADASLLVTARGELMQALPAGGAMVAIEAAPDELPSRLPVEVSVAAVNGPRSLVISGDEPMVTRIAETFAAQGRRIRPLRVSHAFHSARMDPMLASYRQFAQAVDFAPARIPMVSTVTGELIGNDELADPEYWVRQVRKSVRFSDGVAALAAAGVRTFVELGPDAVLSALGPACLPDVLDDVSFAATLRPGRAEVRDLVGVLAHLHQRGASVAWPAVFDGQVNRQVELPTYPFQRRRHWLTPPGPRRDAAALGQADAEHPLLGAVVQLADGDRTLLTGRISAQTHPWLADHVVAGATLLPATAFVELAGHAGALLGSPTVAELTLHSPLVLADGAATALQIVVGPDPGDGRRPVTIHSCSGAVTSGSRWQQHVSGTLAPAARAAPIDADWAVTWPPPGAEPVDLAGWYERLAAQGYQYGDSFRGLRAAWRAAGEVFLHVELPEPVHTEGYRLHPALLDAVLQATELATEPPTRSPDELATEPPTRSPDELATEPPTRSPQVRLPFAWRQVSALTAGARALRVRVTSAGEHGVSIEAADATGAPVANVESFVTRPADAARLAVPADGNGQLYQVKWIPVGSAQRPITYVVLDQGRQLPDVLPQVVVLPVRAAGTGAEAVRVACDETLAVIRSWLADHRTVDCRLAIVTAGGSRLDGDPAGTTDPAHGGVHGLVRATQAEHPGRFLLLDVLATATATDVATATATDVDAATDADGLAAALAAAVTADEPQIAVRAGAVLAPRLALAPPVEPLPSVPPVGITPADGALRDGRSGRLDPAGTVLITGGTGGVGAVLAEHLVRAHGVRHLLLVSRSGPQAAGAGDLAAALAELGAAVRVAACDVSDRSALATVLDGIALEHPLTAVVHAAGVLDDGLVDTLTGPRMEAVAAAKAYAAWHLHELTLDLPLAWFVLCSSAAGHLDGAGQANYAAANAALDALAAYRRAAGLPALSLAWGLWAQAGGMGDRLDDAARRRVDRSGLPGMSNKDNLGLFDAALSVPAATLLPLRLDPAALRSRPGGVPPLLRQIVPATQPGGNRSTTASGIATPDGRPAPHGVAADWARLAPAERQRAVLALVRRKAAAVLGHSGAEAVEPDRAFSEVGFDSLAAVELRNLLTTETGFTLPATLVFDYPTPQALAAYLVDKAAPVADAPAAASDTATAATTDEPIAIVAMACRYPGDVASPEQLWRLVADGVDAVSEFPTDRGWQLEQIYHPEPGQPGRSYVNQGGFLHDAAMFDPEFFGISPREAAAMDPQQRLLLEITWEAVERAGINPHSLRGSRTGVFAGVMYHDWGTRLGQVSEEIAGYLGNGSLASVVSGRIAYTFGFEGPAVTVDTACSSSLVALHWAARALRQGECTLALAGGVTVMSTPDTFIDFSRQRGLAGDGRCKSFAAGADGTGWGEGAGVLLLERLSDAQRNKHPVLAVIRGSAVNSDGASNGLTAPNGPSQERVIHDALASAALRLADIDVVEAHGTGTTLGDPVEAQALINTYGQHRRDDRPLWLGSIKSNLGHTQAAAGVAGVIKMVEAMRHAELPRTLHVDQPSAQVDWSVGEVRLLARARPWPAPDGPRRAAVSSFGISGTNAHVILEQAPVRVPTSASADPGPAHAGVVPLVLSARDSAAMREIARRLVPVVESGVPLTDVARALVGTRAVFQHRAVVLAENPVDAAAGLRHLAAGGAAAQVIVGSVSGDGQVGFVFPGQGSQRLRMGRGLYHRFDVFAAAFDEACTVFADLGLPLRDALLGETDDWLDQTAYVQPALFAVEVALSRLLRSWAVNPEVVLGHSVGELAAAVASGALSLTDGCQLAVHRGRLMQRLPTGGAMAAVGAAEDAVRPLLGDGVWLAAVNGPSAVVLSGSRPAVESAVERLPAGTPVSWLRVSHAFHSGLMNPVLADFRQVVAQVASRPLTVPAVSSVSGGVVDDQWGEPDYWVDQIRQPVRFADAVTSAVDTGVTTIVEVGPGAALSGLVATIAAGIEVVPMLRTGADEVESVLSGVARLWVRGATVDWDVVLPSAADTGSGRGPVDLPTYPFHRKRYWLTASTDLTGVGQTPARHPMLAAALPLAGAGVVLTGRLDPATQPWLADHQVLDTVLLPGTAFVELALRAGAQVDHPVLGELTLQAPLPLNGAAGAVVQVVVDRPGSDGCSIAIHSRPANAAADAAWTRHATGTMRPATTATGGGVTGAALTEWPPTGATAIDVTAAYDMLADRGYGYGPAFHGLQAAWRRGEEIFAEVTLPADTASTGYGIHPALLDAAMHADLLAGGPTLLPFVWNDVVLHRSGASELRVRITRLRGDELSSIDVADVTGQPVASIGTLVSRPVGPAQLTTPPGQQLHTVEWTPASGGEPVTADGWHTIGTPYGTEPAWPDQAALLAAVDGGTPAPQALVLRVPDWDGSGAVPQAARAAVETTLAAAQAFVADHRFDATRLTVVTDKAVRLPTDAQPVLAHAGVWGLIRAAAQEQPGRFQLIDLDSGDATAVAGLRAGIAGDEPELAVRDGRCFVPRLGRYPAGLAAPVTWDPDGTVLITGGTGGLGGLVARHLVRVHGVRHLVLVGRRGSGAPGVGELCAELSGLGARVRVVGCDVADRGAVAGVLAGIDAAHPLTAVVHAAGVAEAGTLTTLTPDAVSAVFGPKVDAAWHLHELTRELPLAAFVLFSSAGGLVLAAGQGTYAAANTVLDQLAEYRTANGLPAIAMAWGMWNEATGMGAPDRANLHRMSRLGMPALERGDALAMFDAALAAGVPAIVPLQVDRAALRARSEVPALLRTLAGRPAHAGDRPVARRGVSRLAELPVEQREQALLDRVRVEVAGVLGYDGPDAVAPSRAFRELGFDSLAAVELRNQLATATGLTLPATMVFDHPTPAAVARLLADRLMPGDPRSADPATADSSPADTNITPGAGAPGTVDDDPIVIVGMACRYPGGVNSPADLWRLVVDEVDAIAPLPTDRGWDVGGIYHPQPGVPGRSYVREGGFLDDVAGFDPDFFGIGRREAIAMDPQQRLLLETAWEAVERAGIDPRTLRGSATGVFAGVMYDDYGTRLHNPPEDVVPYLTNGSSASVLSGRVAYHLGLEGPAVSVDTACSSS
ncbi:SDR family NAD(P)-dependent oxidoreductase, partial [Micromonospora sp. LOL_023]|uniref:SDR family NAD(P)-dependent oxidoreductase n=1 Tax=Micromonospora sp. LOL_023 TaxID=3345418 RepID=UPI003A8A3A71